jgi:hypothetical protein
MAQKTWVSNDVLTAADMNLYASHEGGAWTSYTPSTSQGATPTLTVTFARYARASRLITVQVNLAITSSGSAATAVTMSLPATAATSSTIIAGGGYIVDNSASSQYPGFTYLSSTTAVGLLPASTTTLGLLGATGGFTAALASGDTVQMAFVYESAT